MNLKRCPECNKIIDVDDLKDIDPNEIIGCGLKEDNFDTCHDCLGGSDPIQCNTIRRESRWTQTTTKEYYELGD